MDIRTFRPSDVPALAEIRQAAHSFDQDNLLPRTLDAVHHELERPGLDPERNVFVAESDHGRVVGFARVHLERGQEDIWGCCLTVHPAAREGDAGARLLQAAWERALVRRGESEGRTAWFQSEVNATATWLGGLFEQGGLCIARYELRMRCSLTEADIPPLVAPEGIALRVHRHPQDDHAVNAALCAAFRDSWGSVELSDAEFAHIFDSGYAQADASVVAWAGDEVAGACLNDLGPVRFERVGAREGWVSSLGVRRAWRKHGLATAVLVWTLREAAARGLEAVALDVDAENPTGAKRLYERVGFREVEQFLVYRKQISA
jgi:mycothiol synthase